MRNLFDPISIPDQHILLAKHMPTGKFWQKVFDKDDIWGKLLLGLAVEFYRFQVLEKKLYDEMDIDQANELLVDWEKSVGLPDECFSTTNVSIEKRRSQIKQKFSNFGGVQEKEDFIRIAELFGFFISIDTGTSRETFPLEMPLMFSVTKKAAVHTLVVNIIGYILDGMRFPITFPYVFGEFTESAVTGFPLPFPIPFSKSNVTFLQCIFDFLAPANVKVIILQ